MFPQFALNKLTKQQSVFSLGSFSSSILSKLRWASIIWRRYDTPSIINDFNKTLLITKVESHAVGRTLLFDSWKSSFKRRTIVRKWKPVTVTEKQCALSFHSLNWHPFRGNSQLRSHTLRHSHSSRRPPQWRFVSRCQNPAKPSSTIQMATNFAPEWYWIVF